jgi:general secretion pathway protein L
MAEAAINGGYNVTSGKHFLKWWKQHLWECLPVAWRNRALRSSRPAMVSISDGLVWPARGDLAKPVPIASSPLMSGGASGGSKPVTLVIGERNGFRREVALPLAVEDRLGQVLAYELDRLTPLRPDDLYYDFQLTRRDNTKGLCVVEVLAAPKARVNAMIAAAEEKGVKIERLLLSASDVDNGINLMKSVRQGDDAKASNAWLTPALLLLCAALIAAIVAYPIFKKRQYVIAMLPIESAARAEAETATVLQRQLDKQVGDYNLLLKRKHASPIAVQVLEDLGKRLPDDTWAQTFEIKPMPNSKAREVIVQGETGSGAKLLQLVQESPLLKDPVLKAAMTRVAPNAERFHFAGELIAVEPPGGLALTDANTLINLPMQVTPSGAAGAPTSPTSPLTAGAGVAAGVTTAKPTPPGDAGKSMVDTTKSTTSGVASTSSPGGAVAPSTTSAAPATTQPTAAEKKVPSPPAATGVVSPEKRQ